MSADPKVQVGDIVVLKSGGPEMTISEVLSIPRPADGQLLVACVWFDGSHHSKAVFTVKTLKRKTEKQD